ncbi:MAG: hypothetical protein HZC40_19365 [Chloroflexi bacterium]|nr:hypothetical protein [Chloroflexota bacterium]
MPGWTDLGNIWTTFKELDIRPIADDAQRAVVLAFVGATGAGKSTLIAALRYDQRARDQVITPTIEADLENASRIEADLIVLMLDATRGDVSLEANVYRDLKTAGRNLLIFYNKQDALSDASILASAMPMWSGTRVAMGSAIKPESLATEFVPRVSDALRDKPIALARQYPLFRSAVARNLINDTAFASASYAIGTGFAEMIPALNIPFNITDLIVLTKNQALMVYKLGLALGLSTDWRDHLAEFGGVIGAGFLWRQAARQLVGLIPIWGIVPKVAIAYAGTYAVGEAIVYWYHTGRKISGKDLNELYASAITQGKAVAKNLLARAPRPTWRQFRLPRLALPVPRTKIVCANCGKQNPRDAKFCNQCAAELSSHL